MDRLTTKDIVAGIEIFDLKIGISEEKAFNLLGQYEQTGLTPAEVTELAQAKEEFSRLQQENEQLKELLRLAVEDIKNIADKIADCHELLADGEDEVRSLHLGRCDVCDKNCHNNDDDSDDGCEFVWQHADKLKGLVEI